MAEELGSLFFLGDRLVGLCRLFEVIFEDYFDIPAGDWFFDDYLDVPAGDGHFDFDFLGGDRSRLEDL